MAHVLPVRFFADPLFPPIPQFLDKTKCSDDPRFLERPIGQVLTFFFDDFIGPRRRCVSGPREIENSEPLFHAF